MINLLTAIMTKITTGPSALSNDAGGRIFLDQAPEGTEYPYVVFFIVSDTPDNVFAKKGESVLVQFSLFSSSQSAVEITTMYTDLKALFDDCSMTITSNALSWFRRENLTTMTEDMTTPAGTETVKHWAVDFEVTIQEA